MQRYPSTALAITQALLKINPRMSLRTAAALLTICENEGISQAELSYLMGEAPCTISRAVDELSRDLDEAEGETGPLVERRAWTQDARLRVVQLTPRGRAIRDLLNSQIEAARPIVAA
ncbi:MULTISPECIES: hypothetical protein [Niveispirillum]|uniref:HTH marR-type domain-containing protein n=1 Tax=Niveispirillum lacus TaxID=1981099 RepID=A0A255Z299_9PROT|nr:MULTISPECIES: hypothetical protein [Niveispirillum]MBP7339258.1 hypothetical protein [Niveispirillum sp.]OYQ34770.1 hypothetical protein CHU95_09230 [Niveispirillum lacus]